MAKSKSATKRVRWGGEESTEPSPSYPVDDDVKSPAPAPAPAPMQPAPTQPPAPSPPSSMPWGLITAIFFSILALVALGIGAWMVARSQPRSGKVQGTVATATCKDGSCTITVTYTPTDGTKITSPAVTVKGTLAVGDTVTVRYNPLDPKSISINEISSRLWGWALIALGGLILAITWIWWLIARFSAPLVEQTL